MIATIYTKPVCPYCVEAKRLLKERNISFTEIVVDGTTVTKETMNAALGMTNLQTVPQIVLNGQFIPGGCSGLKKHLGAVK